jgi:hypothetical protein
MSPRIRSFVMPLLLCGCAASVQEIRGTAPANTTVFSGDYAEIGTCVAEELRTGPRGAFLLDVGDLTYEVTDRKSESRLGLTGRTPSQYSFPMIDLLFLGDGNGRTRVESRLSGPTGPGSTLGGRRIEARVWPLIERCAGAASIVRQSSGSGLGMRIGDQSIGGASSNIVVVRVDAGGRAEAGFRVNDVIQKVNGIPVSVARDVADMKSRFHVGERVSFRVRRGSNNFNLTATIGGARSESL